VRFSSITWTMWIKRLPKLYFHHCTFPSRHSCTSHKLRISCNRPSYMDRPRGIQRQGTTQEEICSYLQTVYCFTKYTFSTSRKVIWRNEFFQNPLHLKNCKVNNLLTILHFSVWLMVRYAYNISLYTVCCTIQKLATNKTVACNRHSVPTNIL
jgi:hypothetical protein